MNLDAQRGERIREARDELSWSQQRAADAIGVRREMWAKYEAGAEPGAKVLAAMATVGVDVLYVLTGERGATPLSRQEKQVVMRFRAMGEIQRAQAVGYIEALAAGHHVGGQAISIGNSGPVTHTTGDIHNAPQTYNIGTREKKKK